MMQSMMNYYKITVPNRGTLSVSTGYLSDADTYGVLYDANMNAIASDDDSGHDSHFQIRRCVGPGTYYVQAKLTEAYDEFGDYKFYSVFPYYVDACN